MALLSSMQDKTISGYFLISGAQFQVALLDLAAQRLDPTTTFRYFFETGSGHTMLGNLTGHQTTGVVLVDWLTWMVTDDAKWTSLKP